MDVVDFSLQIVTVRLKYGDKTLFCLAVMPIQPQQPVVTFSHMTRLQNCCNRAWLALVEFNDVLWPLEVKDGIFNASSKELLAQFLYECNMVDLRAIGGQFT